jgi:lipopolysaccharide transport system ATP-binding protein
MTLSQNNDLLVSVEHVSKKFCRNLRRSMAYGLLDLSKSLFSIHYESTKLRKDEFWAIQDISFQLNRGEVLGLVGPNGSGKTTLLRLLAGIFPPDKGQITVKGRVGALIALGAGFHPHLTGRENIFLNGTILGLGRKELLRRFDAIVDFAEIEDFIDAPVSTYSSGMRVRLGFAIASQLEPDILIVDEVLAVGDIGFKSKCYNAITRISKNAAVIFVSHHMPQIARVSSKLIVLNKGCVKLLTPDVPEGIGEYYKLFKEDECIITGTGEAELLDFKMFSRGKQIEDSKNYGDELSFHLKFRINKRVCKPAIYVTFLNQSMQGVMNINSGYDGYNIRNENGVVEIELKLSKVCLNTGIHYISVGVQKLEPFEILRQYYGYRKLIINGDFVGITPVQMKGEWIAN